MEVPHIKITISENDIIEGAKALLPSFRSDWDIKSVKFKIFTDGITNKLLGCFNGSQENDMILIRVYGNKTDLLIDRKAETRNFKLLNAAGLAPRLYATFETGLVYEYVEGNALTVDVCHKKEVYVLVAQALADMHSVQTPGDMCKKPTLWGRLHQFLNLIPVQFSDAAKEARFKELFVHSSLCKEKMILEKEYLFLKEKLSGLESPSVFCHNDLLFGNIIYNSKKHAVTFIDYEYAAYNYQAFDIANHFNEFAGVETVDYSLFPDLEFQKRWIHIYLERFYSNTRSVARKKLVSDDDAESLFNSVQKFTLASHLLWVVWALIQAEYSSIEFDFINYAFIRLQEYYVRKAEIFKY